MMEIEWLVVKYIFQDIKNTTGRVKKPPRFWQNDGKLSIFSVCSDIQQIKNQQI